MALWTNKIHHLSHLFYGKFWQRSNILIDVANNMKGNILEGKWIAFRVSLVGKNGIFELLMINQKKLWKIWWVKRINGTLKNCCSFHHKTITDYHYLMNRYSKGKLLLCHQVTLFFFLCMALVWDKKTQNIFHNFHNDKFSK